MFLCFTAAAVFIFLIFSPHVPQGLRPRLHAGLSCYDRCRDQKKNPIYFISGCRCGKKAKSFLGKELKKSYSQKKFLLKKIRRTYGIDSKNSSSN
jgi:hypothetical protein